MDRLVLGSALLDWAASRVGERGGPGRSGGRSPALWRREERQRRFTEDFDLAVLNDVATWLRLPRLHKHTPNFEGMSWKGIVL